MIWRPPDAAWHARPTSRELAELTIVRLGAPILRQRAEDVAEVDDEVRRFVGRLFATMYAAEGQGLAAPQVGELARCVQHEIDHLDGVLFIDHRSPLARRMLLGRYRKQQTAVGG